MWLISSSPPGGGFAGDVVLTGSITEQLVGNVLR
jgi:hypothetical protein